MPFTGHFDQYYKDILEPAIKDAGYEPVRADEIYGTTTRYPNGTEKTTKEIRVDPRKGFLEMLANFHGLLEDDEEKRIKALARVLTGLPNPDYDDILSVVTGIPKRLLQSCPLDGPVPKELLEMREGETGTFEVEKPNGNGHKNGDGEIS